MSAAPFPCPICLEPSLDPVAAPCGHVFCWRCLYLWLARSPRSRERSPSPVPRAAAGDAAIVELLLAHPTGGAWAIVAERPDDLRTVPPRRAGVPHGIAGSMHIIH